MKRRRYQAANQSPIKHPAIAFVRPQRQTAFRFRMFCLAVLASVAILVSAKAAFPAVPLTLAWEAADDPNVSRYCVFMRTAGESYNYGQPAWEGSETTCTLDNIEEDTTYYFVARSLTGDDTASADSNEVSFYRASQGASETVDVSDDGDDGSGESGTIPPVSGTDSDTDGTGALPITADFNVDTDGFTYADDAFRDTSAPEYAEGVRRSDGGVSGGALAVSLGGIDDDDIYGMSGGWKLQFTLLEDTDTRVSFSYLLTLSTEYEADEAGQVLVSLDGSLYGQTPDDFAEQISGGGDSADAFTSGWRSFTVDCGYLAAGTHELVIGGFNSKKTSNGEITEVLIDNVLVERASADGSGNLSDGNQPDTDNSAPHAPALLSPAYGADNLDLMPLLQADLFSDPDAGDVHAATEWQIAEDSEFNDLAFKVTTGVMLDLLEVPELILDPGTSYFWRVRYYDNHGRSSAWSEPSVFITTTTPIGDENNDGVPDDLAVRGPIDLDGNGVNDNDQADMKVMRTHKGNARIGVKLTEEIGDVVSIDMVDPETISEKGNRPKEMPLELIAFKLNVDVGATIEVGVYLSERMPDGAAWYKYDITEGWQDYSKHARFVPQDDGTTLVILELQDGGTGDADGVANGVIIDPSGPGLARSAAAISDGGAIPVDGSSGGCFIGTTARHERLPAAQWAWVALAALGCVLCFSIEQRNHNRA